MSKKYLILVMILLSSFLFSQETIKVGFFNIPPHIYVEDGESTPVGAIVDHWENALAPAMNVNVEWVGPLSFPEVISSMQNGEIDVMALATHNPEREQFMSYPDFNLFETGAFVVLMNADPLDEIANWSALRGRQIAIGNTYPYRQSMVDAGLQLVEPDVTMINLEGFDLLKSGTVQGIGVQQSISVFYDLKNSNNLFLARNVKVLPVLSEGFGAAYSTFHPSRDDLLNAYNSFLQANADRRYETFVFPYIH